MRVMTLHICHHIMHPMKNASTANVNAWELCLCMGFHVMPQQRWIHELCVALRTLVWSLSGRMEKHVVSKHLLAAAVLTADGAPKLVTIDIAEMGIIFMLHKEALAALFVVVMAVQDCPVPPPGPPLQMSVLACAFRCI